MLFTEVCIILALSVLVLFLIFAGINRDTATKRFSLVLAGICVSSFFLFLPTYWSTSQTWITSLNLEEQAAWYPKLRTMVYALFYCLKAMAGGQEMGLLEKMEIGKPFFQFLYTVLNYSYFVAGPLMTSGLALSLIGDLWDRIRYRFQFRRNYNVFSHPNDISLSIAVQIRKKYPRAVIVFCSGKDVDKKVLLHIRKLGGICVYAPCDAMGLPFGKKRIDYYLVNADEDANLRTAERMIVNNRDKNGARMVINALAASGTGIQVVESMEKGRIGIRFIDATALLCSDLLLRHPMYHLPAGKKDISVAVMGCDRTGMQLVKTVAWCGQMDGKSLKIRVYDKNAPAVEQRFLALCPELRKSCDIRFYEADISTADFEQKLMDSESGCPDATYCVVAVGDDEENLSTAERIYRLYRARNDFSWTPTILARVRTSTKAEVYAGQENSYLKARGIYTFGGVSETLSAGLLFHSTLERMSFAVNLCYWGLLPDGDPSEMTVNDLKAYLKRKDVTRCWTDFLHSEYSRRSSMAAALHIPVKLSGCGMLPDGENFPSDDTARKFRKALQADEALLDRLARNEHLRWNSFMRSEGYRCASWEELEQFYPQVKNNQDPLSKRHLCIVDWEELDELNRKYLELNPPVRKNFKKSDYDLIRDIPKIIMLVNRLEETDADMDL